MVCKSHYQNTTFAITDTRLYVPVVTLSTQHNAKLLQEFQSGFKRTINGNKYQSKLKTQAPKRYLDCLIDPRFQEVNRLFALAFDINANRIGHAKFYLLLTKIEDYNVMIDEKPFLINQSK